MATTTDLNTLKINYLSQEQYDAAVSGGTINANEIYMTPAIDTITDVTVDGTSVVSDGVAEITMPTIPTRYARALAKNASVTLGTKSVKAILYVFGGVSTARGSLLISGYTSSATDTQILGGSLTDIGISVSGQDLIITNNSAYNIVYGIDVYSGTLTIT